MASTTGSNQESRGTSSVVLWVIGIGLAILLIWLWNTAGGARTLAEQNARLINQPELEVQYLIGGPERFAEEFDEAVEDAELGDLDTGEMLWSTALVTNVGHQEAQDVALTTNLRPELTPTVIASTPDFGSAPAAEQEEGTVEISVEDIGADEQAYVFFGFAPDALAAADDDWPAEFENVFSSMTVEADDSQDTVYGRWL